jgi:hypothetical protein
MFVPLLRDPHEDLMVNEILQILLTIKAGTIESPRSVTSLETTLGRLAPHISVASSQHWLEVVNKFESPFFQVIATATLASYLPMELKERVISEGLRVARAIENASLKGSVFLELAPHLPQHQKEEILCEALQIAGKIEMKWFRVLLLARLTPHLTKLPHHILYPVWQVTLHVLATRTRRAFVGDLGALSPVLLTLGGNTAIEETIQAIEDVGKWWL